MKLFLTVMFIECFQFPLEYNFLCYDLLLKLLYCFISLFHYFRSLLANFNVLCLKRHAGLSVQRLHEHAHPLWFVHTVRLRLRH